MEARSSKRRRCDGNGGVPRTTVEPSADTSYLHVGGRPSTDVQRGQVRSNVRAIPDQKFENHELLKVLVDVDEKVLVLPEGIEIIGERAFKGCRFLTRVEVSEGSRGMRVRATGRSMVTRSQTAQSLTGAVAAQTFEGCISHPSPPPDIWHSRRKAFTSLDKYRTGGVGVQAFEGCTSLELVEIPSTLPGIRRKAFASLVNLKAVKLREGLREIGEYAFHNCESLRHVLIPSTVAIIGRGAFTNCKGMKRVFLLEGLELILEEAFSSCESLKKVAIPSTVEAIDRSAFRNCANLTEVELREGLRWIKGYAFADCPSLNDITLPGTMLSIEPAAFQNCSALKYVNIREGGIERIGRRAFHSCHSLEEIVIPPSVRKINYRAFSGCLELKKVELNDGLRVIGAEAFQFCYSLESLDLPSTLVEIGENAFRLAPLNDRICSIYDKTLCDTSSINSTYASNHVITSLPHRSKWSERVAGLLALNSFFSELLSVRTRLKILHYHSRLDMKPFLKWGEKILRFLPLFVRWFNRACYYTSLLAGSPLEGDRQHILYEDDINILERKKLDGMYQFLRMICVTESECSVSLLL